MKKVKALTVVMRKVLAGIVRIRRRAMINWIRQAPSGIGIVATQKFSVGVDCESEYN